jgi:hypothetical protein
VEQSICAYGINGDRRSIARRGEINRPGQRETTM